MEKNYFKHDFYARQDDKLVELQINEGMAGIGIFWCLTEMLYENGGCIKYNVKSLAFNLHCTSEEITNVVENYGLFFIEEGMLTSTRVQSEIQRVNDIIEKKKKAIKDRWNKEKEKKNKGQQELNLESENNDTGVSNNDTNVSKNNTGVSNNDTSVLNNDTDVLKNNSNVIQAYNTNNTSVIQMNEKIDTNKSRVDKSRVDKSKTLSSIGESVREKNKPLVEFPKSLDDVMEYAKELKNSFQFDKDTEEWFYSECADFYNHYNSYAWYDGKDQLIKNWHSKLEYWVKKHFQEGQEKIAKKAKQKTIRPEVEDAVSKALREAANINN